ncbi:MAG: hypothetical protein QM793_08405 [Muricomes sp.]
MYNKGKVDKGIHLYLLENEMLAEEQEELLRIFIDKYYGSEKYFLIKISRESF